MKAFILLTTLLLSPLLLAEDFHYTSFDLKKDLPVTARLKLPAKVSKIHKHDKTENKDTITASISDDRLGTMVVEILDQQKQLLWSGDFGYNLSATPGCSISIECHPSQPYLIIQYYGYKWDHRSLLLKLETQGETTKVLAHNKLANDILTYLKKQPGYSPKHQYTISPRTFTEKGLTLECIPLELPETKLPHPLAQGERWFTVTAKIEKDFTLTPTESKITH
ncbi:hypothetical protein Rhal01_03692 [Rubritalea halochordaticola]|uniref:Uncharacterized protein n=1 Tax=Rubritalea halochordaticola TaxID=714537 RepID=A0ABP9V8V8_9BACT